MTLSVSKREREAAGILNFESMCWSIVFPCKTNMTAEKTMPVAQTGRRRITDFSSSTWVTVQRRHGLSWPDLRINTQRNPTRISIFQIEHSTKTTKHQKYVPELLRVLELAATLNTRRGIARLVQKRPVFRYLHVKLPKRSNQDLKNPRDRAAAGPLQSIHSTPEHKEGHSHGHGSCRNPESPTPTDIHLNPNKHGRGHEGPNVNREVEIVEKRAFSLLFLRVLLVKLVGAKGGNARLDATCPERD
ncbi:NAD(P)-binding Rossmann-fold superfamily protein [Striga asiatica]|uniref:NAD(P)-binding Rossmann-fold superfamily protein n=1 Tax=Striga asiatica TaxID=4170 RepID=A0A5A7NZI8_STRAF|nr:NAD(P)-binding Rossmann-fold superfamily protein [Striga asiatica]